MDKLQVILIFSLIFACILICLNIAELANINNEFMSKWLTVFNLIISLALVVTTSYTMYDYYKFNNNTPILNQQM